MAKTVSSKMASPEVKALVGALREVNANEEAWAIAEHHMKIARIAGLRRALELVRLEDSIPSTPTRDVIGDIVAAINKEIIAEEAANE